MDKNYLERLLKKEMSRKEFMKFSALMFISIFGFAGVITELLTHAAEPEASQEAESGSLSGSAKIVTDTLASGGEAVQFGTYSSGGGATYFPATDPFNAPIVANPVLHANNSVWQSKFESMFSSMDTSTLYGWPLYIASSSDPEVTCHGSYQNATFHLPPGATPSGDSDGHLLIVEPVGVSPTHPTVVCETEIYVCTVSGTTVTPGDCATPCQFNVSTTNGNDNTNIASSSPGSARGCGICCLAGLVLEAEFLAGEIPHALCATCSWTASGGEGVGWMYPAIISDGKTSGGIPEGARIQLDPAYDISGLTASEQIIAKALQVYGFYVTDSTDPGENAVVFEAQVATTTNSAYSGFDEHNGNTLGGLGIWSHMRVLASWDGS